MQYLADTRERGVDEESKSHRNHNKLGPMLIAVVLICQIKKWAKRRDTDRHTAAFFSGPYKQFSFSIATPATSLRSEGNPPLPPESRRTVRGPGAASWGRRERRRRRAGARLLSAAALEDGTDRLRPSRTADASEGKLAVPRSTCSAR